MTLSNPRDGAGCRMTAPDGCCIAAAGSVVTRLVQDFKGLACDPCYAMPRRHSADAIIISMQFRLQMPPAGRPEGR
jgi:hypothetical protein